LLDIIYLYEIKKNLVIDLNGTGGSWGGRINRDYVTSVQYKPNWNCHYESPTV
jgi:hypothetical protein